MEKGRAKNQKKNNLISLPQDRDREKDTETERTHREIKTERRSHGKSWLTWRQCVYAYREYFSICCQQFSMSDTDLSLQS